MRYNNGTGYFWINDNNYPHPTMIMHPTIPKLDGTVLDHPKFNNAQGVDKNLFTAFVEVTKNGNNEGYVDYLWPKPTNNGLTERKPKESYARLHKASGWIIGSGVYIDSIDDAVALKKEEIDSQISDLIVKSIIAAIIFIIATLVASFMFASTLAKPIQQLTEITKNISLGKNLEDPIEGVDRLKFSVKIMISRMADKLSLIHI